MRALRSVHRDIAAFRPPGFGPPVHGAAVATRVFLIGQAPGPHEARLGKPFAWTAGKTLFGWLERAKTARRYDPRHFPYFNLARIYIKRHQIHEAIRELEGAVRIEPRYTPARRELHRLLGMLN